MLSFEDALQRVVSSVKALQPRPCPLSEALGRGLAASVVASCDQPAFDNSSVDGYGVVAGPAQRLSVLGVSAAGAPFSGEIGAGEAVRIFTGAPVPAGVTAVVMQEQVEAQGAVVSVPLTSAGDLIRRRGEDFRSGDLLFPAGTQITASVMGVLASQGITELSLPPVPTVAIVSTGDELVPLGGNRAPWQIFESNSVALTGACQALRIPVRATAVARDDVEEQARAFAHALEGSDVLLIVGGMSVGDRDHARAALARIGMEEQFWRVRMRPGKPFLFGKVGGKPIFGLPGNPVSSQVAFHLLVRPALRRMLGVEQLDGTLYARLGRRAEKPAGRTDFQRGTLESRPDGLWAFPLDEQGSHLGRGLAIADCLIKLPEVETSIAQGEAVEVVPWGG